MAQNSDARGSDEPKNGGEGRSPEAEWDSDDKQRGVELGGGGAPAAELKVVALELANTVHAANHEADDEEQHHVGEQAVDAEHDKDSRIVAREVAQVVVDPALHFAEIGGLREALHIEELGNGAQVREARGERLRPQAIEAPGESGRQGVQRNAQS